MRPSRIWTYVPSMGADVLAIFIGIVCFAVLYAILEGIDRI